jgi:hypothetical protein
MEAFSLSDLARRERFILHINHASILIRNGDRYLLCDPWFIAPAFGTWTQNPSPPAALINFILSIDPKKLAVAVSHGHDDHLDDFFVRHHLSGARFFVPEFPGPGLVNRVSAITQNPPSVLTDGELEWDGFRLSRIVNEDFTGYDSIINIETDDFTVIHANDNWHDQPEDVLERLRVIKSRGSGKFYYFSQIGVADSFPLCYPQYTDAELRQITETRLQNAIDALQRNMQALEIGSAYAYANQSRVQSAFAKKDFDGFAIARQMISARGQGPFSIGQLMPGCYFLTDEPNEQSKQLTLKSEDLLSFCVRKFEARANEFVRTAPGEKAAVHFGFPSAQLSDEKSVLYAADKTVWQGILTGKINLEAIGVGGGGMIMKNPKDFNMRDVHHALCKFAYIAQNRFNISGLDWLIRD